MTRGGVPLPQPRSPEPVLCATARALARTGVLAPAVWPLQGEAHVPPSLEIFRQNGSFERGTSPCTLHPPVRESCSPKAVWVDFRLFRRAGCYVAQRRLILRCLFFCLFFEQCSLCKCHAVMGGRRKEPEPCSFPEQTQRSILLVPFIQLRG